MKKNTAWTIGGIIVVIVLIVIGIAVFHKSKTPSPSSNQSATTPSVSNSVLASKTSSTVGTYLADPNGNALYTIGSGSAGVSNCTGGCLSAWPPYQDKGATTGLPTNVGTIKRTDNGDIQYTYKGSPLYYFTSDSSGQVTGNGVSGFSVAKP